MENKLNQSDLSWETIHYNLDVPNEFLVPEHHWPELMNTSLSKPQRIRLNHFLTYFMCEMFIHFERSIINYIEYNKSLILDYLSESQINKFIDEEKDHIRAFQKLAKIIRPDLYSETELFFLKTSTVDRWITKYTPLLPFFMMAFLFEEMTLFVSIVMEEKLDESWKPVLEVMQLHAKEEKGHIGMDRKVVENSIQEGKSLKTYLGMNSILPLVAISDRKVAKAWKNAANWFAEKEKLSSKQKKEILRKGLSKSDKLGMESFLNKLKKRPLPGTRLLNFALSTVSK